MKFILTILIITFNVLCFAQQNKSSKENQSNHLVIDYNTGNISFDSSIKNTLKKLRVNSILQISVINLPPFYKVKGSAVFDNDKMEGSAIFNGLAVNRLDGQLATANIDTTKKMASNNKEAINDIKKTNVSSDSNFYVKLIDATTVNNGYSNKTNSKFDTSIIDIPKRRINIDNLREPLKISNVKQIFTKIDRQKAKSIFSEEDAVSFEKARVDYFSQARIINIAQDNINERMRIKDSLIKVYAYKADEFQNMLSNEINAKKTITKPNNVNLIGIQILNRDYTNIELEILDSQNRRTNLIPLTFNNLKGFKLDFSTGFFNSFQKNYTYEKIQADTFMNGSFRKIDSVFKIKQNSLGSNNLSIGILAHAYTRSYDYINFGLAVGFSYLLGDKDNTRLNLLAGGSVLLGKEQRFIINGGIAFSKVKELTLYQIDKQYNQSILNSTTDLKLSEKTATSLFIGITYNLGNLKTLTKTTLF